MFSIKITPLQNKLHDEDTSFSSVYFMSQVRKLNTLAYMSLPVSGTLFYFICVEKQDRTACRLTFALKILY